MDLKATVVDTWSPVGMLTAAISSGGLACGLVLLIGMAIVEIPFSMPFAVILGNLLVLLGAIIVVNIVKDRKARRMTHTTVTFSKICVQLTEYAILTVVATLSLASGVFAMLLYFQAKTLPPYWRTFMYCVVGAALTTFLSMSVVGIMDMIMYEKFGVPVTVVKGNLRLKPHSPDFKLFPRFSQNCILYFASLTTGLYYGFIYGQVAARQLAAADASVRFNPWNPVSAYLEYTLPVAAAVGFFAVLVAALIPTLFKQQQRV